MLDNVNFNRIHFTPAYYFTVRYPVSMRTVRDGNLFAAMMSQGHVLFFNSAGESIGQILFPERVKGTNLHTASLVINPDL